MVKLLLSGSGGFVGEAVSSYFERKGYEVVRLRRKPLDAFDWDLEGGFFDVVIHLAGEPIFTRWSKEKKRRILLSRSIATTNLAAILLKNPPTVFISASAVGYYGCRGEEILTEESGSGSGFLPQVCREWEKASELLEGKGSRVVRTRFGLVLGKGGVLQKIRPLFKLGLGGPIGSGKQWMSWIALEDLVRALNFSVEHSEIEGVVNFVSPHAVRQRGFAALLAKCLHRPSFFPLPEWVLKVVFGEMSRETILCSQHVLPKKLQKGHFSFLWPNLEEYLCQLN